MGELTALEMKPMRKGTRSCRECRRRKIKCNWSSDAATICSECSKHSRQCLSQGIVVDKFRVAKPDTKLTIKVNRIEPIVERLAKLQDTQAKGTAPPRQPGSLQHLQAHLEDLDHLDAQARKTSPLYGLFNNEVITQIDKSGTLELNTASIVSFGNQNASDLEKLQSTISQEPYILGVLDMAKDWWIAWRDQSWALRNHKPQSLRSFVELKLSSADPVMYSVGLMCIALTLQQLRPGEDDVSVPLSTPPAALLDRINAAVDTIILTQYLHDENTVLVALQRAKVHAEGNQLRKSWLRIRHAVLMTQQTHYAESPDMTPDERLLRQRWVGSIYEMDSFLSLVLGFPHPTSPNFTDTLALSVLQNPFTDLPLRMRALRRVLAIVACRINNRNASSPSPTDTTLTCSIQAQLNSAASHMPADWWSIPYHTSSPDAHAAHEHLLAQLWFWQLQAFLHLPHMLSANLPHHHTLCLQGARNMLRTFTTLRSHPTLTIYICACEDFQGVFSACILLVGLLLHISQGSIPASIEDDLAVLDDVKDIFRYRSTQQGGAISKQGLRAIEQLESYLYADAGSDVGGRRSIILPYFGLIRIQAKALPQPQSQHQQGNPPSQESYLSNPATHHTTNGPLPSPSLSLELTPDSLDYNKQPSNDLIDQALDNVDYDFMFLDPVIDWDQFLFGDELARDWNDPGKFPLNQCALSNENGLTNGAG